MSIALDRFCFIESLAIPMAHVLSHIIIVGGCGCPRSDKIVRRLAACCPPANKAAYSASPALETMHGMIEEKTCTAPLILRGWLRSPRKK